MYYAGFSAISKNYAFGIETALMTEIHAVTAVYLITHIVIYVVLELLGKSHYV